MSKFKYNNNGLLPPFNTTTKHMPLLTCLPLRPSSVTVCNTSATTGSTQGGTSPLLHSSQGNIPQSSSSSASHNTMNKQQTMSNGSFLGISIQKVRWGRLGWGIAGKGKLGRTRGRKAASESTEGKGWEPGKPKLGSSPKLPPREGWQVLSGGREGGSPHPSLEKVGSVRLEAVWKKKVAGGVHRSWSRSSRGRGSGGQGLLPPPPHSTPIRFLSSLPPSLGTLSLG